MTYKRRPVCFLAEQIQKIGLTTSEIIRVTSGDRSHVIAGFDYQPKQKSIREAKGWKLGIQEEYQATAFGFEILKLIEDITTLNKTNEHLRPLIEKKRNDHMKNIEEPRVPAIY